LCQSIHYPLSDGLENDARQLAEEKTHTEKTDLQESENTELNQANCSNQQSESVK
jgi:hypothetical protein